jgi:glycosyltransferase involved in cell wall biosynthesis
MLDPSQSFNYMSTKRLKVLYISGPAFLDMDLSFVRALSQKSDAYFLLDLYPKLRKATALNLENAPEEADIIPMSQFPGMEIYGKMMSLNQSFVINRISNSPLALSNLVFQWKLFSFIQHLNPDVIHFNNQIYFNHFYLFLLRRKTLISIHDPFPHSGEEHHTKKLSAKLYQWLNVALIKYHLLYNNLMNGEYAENRKMKSSRILNSSLGPYEYLSVLDRNDTPQFCDFLFFGRIERYKGLDLLLESFAQVIDSYPDATLTIAGSGSFWFDIKKYDFPEKNLRILNRFIPGEELANLISGAKVVVCPYRDATQSGVVMSAYAFCKPVIVTNVGALAQVVEEGQSGFVVEPNDSSALAAAMIRVLQGELSQHSSSQAIDALYFKGRKSWASIVKQILPTYQKVIGNH